MNFKIFATVLLSLSSINTFSVASSLKDIMHPKSSHTQTSNPSYTDFTGTWTSAKCLGNEITMVIENNDNYITFNGEEMHIGAMTTKSSSGIKNWVMTTTSSDIESVEWNANKTQLIFKSITVNKAFADQDNQDTTIDTSMYFNLDFLTLELINEQLQLKMNTAEFKDLQRIDSSHPTCIFVKSEQ